MINIPPTKKFCERHAVEAELVGFYVDYDAFVYKCPDGHGLLDDGEEISLYTIDMLSKINTAGQTQVRIKLK